MTDMSITSDLTSASKRRTDTANLFRGMFIEKCSVVEAWARQTLKQRGEIRCPPLREMMRTLHQMAEEQPSPFRHPKRVAVLLDRFSPYAELRATLAHSTLTTALLDDTDWVALFKPCTADPDTAWRSVAVSHAVMDRIRSDLSKIANELTHQHLR